MKNLFLTFILAFILIGCSENPVNPTINQTDKLSSRAIGAINISCLYGEYPNEQELPFFSSNIFPKTEYILKTPDSIYNGLSFNHCNAFNVSNDTYIINIDNHDILLNPYTSTEIGLKPNTTYSFTLEP